MSVCLYFYRLFHGTPQKNLQAILEVRYIDTSMTAVAVLTIPLQNGFLVGSVDGKVINGT